MEQNNMSTVRETKTVIVDLEFTGLDNNFVKDNEIIQAKAYCLETGEGFLQNYSSITPLRTHAYLTHGVERYSGELFTAQSLIELLTNITHTEDICAIDCWGYSPQSDMKMLEKYGISLAIRDIKEKFQCSPLAYRLATEGSSLECCYYMVTGQRMSAKHDTFCELMHIVHLYGKMKELEADGQISEYMQIVPFGFCAGMPIQEFCVDYRRIADGYRYNNSDLYAISLDRTIYDMERSEYEDWYDDEGECDEDEEYFL